MVGPLNAKTSFDQLDDWADVQFVQFRQMCRPCQFLHHFSVLWGSTDKAVQKSGQNGHNKVCAMRRPISYRGLFMHNIKTHYMLSHAITEIGKAACKIIILHRVVG